MEHTYSPKQFGKLIGKSVNTLQKWDRQGILHAYRSPTNRRYYTHEQYLQYRGLISSEQGKVIAYARVSSPSQKKDLATQREALRAYCQDHHIRVDQWVEDIGSALNYKRKGFNEVVEQIELGQVSRLIIAYQDRFVRFGYDWFEHFCERHGTDITVMNGEAFSPEEASEKPTALKLKKQFNEIRREQFPWTWDVTKNASDQPFLDLGKAFSAFFEGVKNGKRKGRPKFKSKKRSKASFYLANDQFELGDHRIWIPKLGWVNMAENLRLKGKVTGARVTKTADWWFVSLTVDMPDETQSARTAAVGIDVGLNRLATLSTSEGYENQAFLRTALKKLRQTNKRLHRRKPGSKNREKARREVARLHYRITCMRDDVLHKLTTRLANCYRMVGIENLNLKGLLKNRKLARSFSDASLGKLLDLLTSKVEQRGGQVIKVGRFFASSKTCHGCGWKWEDMELSDRNFLCQNPSCAYYQVAQDRDHNAALCILFEALRLIELIDQAVNDIGSGDDVNLTADAG